MWPQSPIRSKARTKRERAGCAVLKSDGGCLRHASFPFWMPWRWSIVGCALAACSSRVPHPSYVAPSATELVEVDYPPPPARVEFVPPQPASGAVWLNGEWGWAGRRWGWKPGGWVMQPEGAAYAKGALVRRQDGKLFAGPSRWQGPDGGAIQAPTFLRATPSERNSIVDPEGDPAATTGDLGADAGTGDPQGSLDRADAAAVAPAATGEGAEDGGADARVEDRRSDGH